MRNTNPPAPANPTPIEQVERQPAPPARALSARWWLRSRVTTREIVEIAPFRRTLIEHGEIFVPWWAWPLEGVHRLIFSLPGGAIEPAPIPMILHCPQCTVQHIDRPEPEKGWLNEPHRSHLCAACGWIWRPADLATTGVATIETRGKDDSKTSLHTWRPQRELAELYATIFSDGGHRYEWLRSRVVPSPDFENCLIPAALHHARIVWAELLRRADWHPCRATAAAVDVLTERQRQTAIGWTPDHDDAHDPGDIALAGAAYALQAGCVLNPHDGAGFCDPSTLEDTPPPFWPWVDVDAYAWKPKDPRSNLVRAGALILAEIERLDRAAGSAS